MRWEHPEARQLSNSGHGSIGISRWRIKFAVWKRKYQEVSVNRFLRKLLRSTFKHVGCVFCLSVFGYVSAGGLVSDLKIEHRARALQPGEVLVIQVSSEKNLELLKATLGDREFPFFETAPNQWLGLIGLDLSLAVGLHEVRFEGNPESLGSETYRVQVADKEFPVRRLRVDSKYVSPPQEALSRIREEQKLVGTIFDRTTETRLWKGPFIRPVPGKTISAFGKRNIMNGVPRSPHSGTDFRASKGTPIKSPNHGKVVLVKELYFAGNTIIVDHGLGLYSYFAHLSEFEADEGDLVEKGQVVGQVGFTGLVTGPHLHWSLRLGGARVDPVSLIEVLADFEE